METRRDVELKETTEMVDLTIKLKAENTDIFNAVKNIMLDMNKRAN